MIQAHAARRLRMTGQRAWHQAQVASLAIGRFRVRIGHLCSGDKRLLWVEGVSKHTS
jgi:hypothetical protein